MSDEQSSLGLESGTVRVVDYDAAWPRLFAEERIRIQAVLGADLPLSLEHSGSTAVPGLPAKPILDILAGFPPGASVLPYIEALVSAGYIHRGEQGIPGRQFFRRGHPRAYHLHLAEREGSFWQDQLVFRDALRANPELRDEYAALKMDLARRFPRERETYTEGKSAFVLKVVASSRRP